MRRLALLAVSIAGLALAASALAKDVNPVLDAAAISSAQCMTPGSGAKQVVDVSFQLTNYADSGYVGAWACDTVNRHLRIWKQAGGVVLRPDQRRRQQVRHDRRVQPGRRRQPERGDHRDVHGRLHHRGDQRPVRSALQEVG